jgi:hypothetical protein
MRQGSGRGKDLGQGQGQRQRRSGAAEREPGAGSGSREREPGAGSGSREAASWRLACKGWWRRWVGEGGCSSMKRGRCSGVLRVPACSTGGGPGAGCAGVLVRLRSLAAFPRSPRAGGDWGVPDAGDTQQRRFPCHSRSMRRCQVLRAQIELAEYDTSSPIARADRDLLVPRFPGLVLAGFE